MNPNDITRLIQLLKPIRTLVTCADLYDALDDEVDKAENAIIGIEMLLEKHISQLRLKDFEDASHHEGVNNNPDGCTD